MSNYKNMEEVLHLINRKYISLDNDQVKHNNERLISTLRELLEIMKEQDPLFEELFEKPYFGGSYYNDLKVGKPDEFDLDLLLTLPTVCEIHRTKKCGCVTVSPSNIPGFFWFQVQKGFCADLDKFIKDNYIQTNLVLNWLKSKVIRALNKLRSNSSIYNYSIDSNPPPTYSSESGPALRLKIYGNFGTIDVDLVPAFKFGPEYWPQAGYRINTTTKMDFFLVPKSPKGTVYDERYWRPSFQEQENEIIKSKERLKPSLRLLKKMRNNLIHSSISSYALKTIVLWENYTGYFNSKETLSDTFMKLLEKYVDSLHNKKIPYFWNDNNNLLDGIDPRTLENHHNEISRLLETIKKQHKINPCIVAKVILKEGTQEYNEFIAEYNQPKRDSNLHEISASSSRQGTSYYTFEPRATTVNSPPSNQWRNNDGSFSTSSNYNSRGTTQPTVEHASTGWDTTFNSPPSNQWRNNDGSFSTSSNYNSGGTTQQTVEDSSTGWATAGNIMLGIGAAAAVGLGIMSFVNRNNRNQD